MLHTHKAPSTHVGWKHINDAAIAAPIITIPTVEELLCGQVDVKLSQLGTNTMMVTDSALQVCAWSHKTTFLRLLNMAENRHMREWLISIVSDHLEATEGFNVALEDTNASCREQYDKAANSNSKCCDLLDSVSFDTIVDAVYSFGSMVTPSTTQQSSHTATSINNSDDSDEGTNSKALPTELDTSQLRALNVDCVPEIDKLPEYVFVSAGEVFKNLCQLFKLVFEQEMNEEISGEHLAVLFKTWTAAHTFRANCGSFLANPLSDPDIATEVAEAWCTAVQAKHPVFGLFLPIIDCTAGKLKQHVQQVCLDWEIKLSRVNFDLAHLEAV